MTTTMTTTTALTTATTTLPRRRSLRRALLRPLLPLLAVALVAGALVVPGPAATQAHAASYTIAPPTQVAMFPSLGGATLSLTEVSATTVSATTTLTDTKVFGTSTPSYVTLTALYSGTNAPVIQELYQWQRLSPVGLMPSVVIYMWASGQPLTAAPTVTYTFSNVVITKLAMTLNSWGEWQTKIKLAYTRVTIS